eukprot:TRINITY_DN5047_c0_g1_i2.p1 TRINITY_DN5047_c0_g1~~TRINITY_DN5047_c0_g1_i2.p1  ORF type:complete len:974 (+),score=280.89 TRINITY_DN5047_c0_g1_i2:12-2933(+)
MNPHETIKKITNLVHLLLSNTKLPKDKFDKEKLSKTVRDLSALADSILEEHDCEESTECSARIKKLIAKTLLFIQANLSGKDPNKEEFAVAVKNFQTSFGDYRKWIEDRYPAQPVKSTIRSSVAAPQGLANRSAAPPPKSVQRAATQKSFRSSRDIYEEELQREMEKMTKREIEDKYHKEKEQLRRDQEELILREKEVKIMREKEALARKEQEIIREREEKIRKEAEEKLRKQMEDELLREKEVLKERIRRDTEANAKRDYEQKLAFEKAQLAQEKEIQLLRESLARKEAEEKARREAEERAKEEQERRILEEKLRIEAEEKARIESEARAQQEAARQRLLEENARQEAERRRLIEEKERLLREEKIRREAEEKARLEAEEKARQEADRVRLLEEKARILEQKAREAEEIIRIEAQRQAKLLQEKEEAERQARLAHEKAMRAEALVTKLSSVNINYVPPTPPKEEEKVRTGDDIINFDGDTDDSKLDVDVDDVLALLAGDDDVGDLDLVNSHDDEGRVGDKNDEASDDEYMDLPELEPVPPEPQQEETVQQENKFFEDDDFDEFLLEEFGPKKTEPEPEPEPELEPEPEYKPVHFSAPVEEEPIETIELNNDDDIPSTVLGGDDDDDILDSLLLEIDTNHTNISQVQNFEDDLDGYTFHDADFGNDGFVQDNDGNIETTIFSGEGDEGDELDQLEQILGSIDTVGNHVIEDIHRQNNTDALGELVDYLGIDDLNLLDEQFDPDKFDEGDEEVYDESNTTFTSSPLVDTFAPPDNPTDDSIVNTKNSSTNNSTATITSKTSTENLSSSSTKSKSGKLLSHSKPVDKEGPPNPTRPLQKETEKKTPETVRIQVVSARGIKASGNVSVVISRKSKDKEKNKEKVAKIFTTTSVKSDKPVWNELFQLNVYDPDNEVIILSLKGSGLLQSKIPGEISFPLRASMRDFDNPNFQYQWYTLTSGSTKCGELQLYLEYYAS